MPVQQNPKERTDVGGGRSPKGKVPKNSPESVAALIEFQNLEVQAVRECLLEKQKLKNVKQSSGGKV